MSAQRYFSENSTWQENLTGIRYSATIFGDIDNDGDLDLALSGCTSASIWTCTNHISKIYINNGTALEENQTWQENLTGISSGSLAFGDVDNDGDLDLALAGCSSGGGYSEQCSTYVTKIYINNDTSLVENQTWQENLTEINLEQGALAFGDVDNDGDLDLAVVGADSSSKNGIYINNGSSFVKNSVWLESLPLVGQGYGGGALAFGDVDNDGDLDLVFAGSVSTNFYTGVYINNDTSLVENSTWKGDFLALFGFPSLAIGDYDNDSKIDITVIGARSGDHHRVYRNNGNNFTEAQREDQLGGIFYGSVIWGDYTNDGRLDLAANGREGWTSTYYYNGSQFIRDTNQSLIYLEYGSSINWIDLDNDNDLDLLETGYNSNYEAKIYTSNRSLTKANTQPNASTSFSSNYSSGQITLNWSQGSDNETNANGLYYNLKLGNCSGCQNIVSGIYGGGEDNGYFGNMMQRRSITLSGDWLQENITYYWSVQTIDTSLAKSNWSAEQNFTAPSDITSPEITLNLPEDNNYTDNLTIIFNATISDNENLINISLYGDWGSGWHLNETNSSGINNTNYIFTKEMSSEGVFYWKIYACDNDNNCIFSNSRIFTVDTAYPQVSLISPSNGATWTSSSTVIFNYSVSDIDIANCSLIINNSIYQTDTDVDVSTTQTFSKSLSNAVYSWYVNCSDYLNRENNSETRNLTVSYSSNGGSGGGGSGNGEEDLLEGIITTAIYVVGNLEELEEESVSKELREGDSIKFNLSGEEHILNLKEINNESVVIEISSNTITAVLNIGEEKKFNLSSADYYDLAVILNGVNNLKANLTLKAIYEDILEEVLVVCGDDLCEENETSENCCVDCGCLESYECKEGVCVKIRQKVSWILVLSIGVVIIVVLVVLMLRRKRR